jgi:hypothetical protein
VLFMIVQAGLNIASSKVNNPGLSMADAMVDIIGKAKFVYETETGQPLDISKIKPYIPLE